VFRETSHKHPLAADFSLRREVNTSFAGHIGILHQNPFRPMRKALLISLVIIFVGGCTLKAGYNRLDWMLTEYLESYVELNKAQKTALQQRMAASLEWHRRTQLPAYVLLLQSVKHDVQHGISQAQVEQHGLQLLVLWRALMVRFADDMTVLLPQLDAQQREALFESFAEQNAEYHEDYIQVSRQQQRENYADWLEDNFERWLGSLTEQQEQRIATSATQIQPIATDALKTRLRWQQQLREILRNHKDTATTQVAMQQLFVQPEQLRTEHYTQRLIHNSGVITHLIADIGNQLTDKQHQHFNKRIDKYSKLFEELAAEGQVKPARQCEAC
jgi:hypothetical protein